MGYYLNGLVPLSYQLDDTNLVRIRERHVTHILDAQAQDGTWLGPSIPAHSAPGSNSPAHNYWSKHFAIVSIQSYYEASPANADKRTLVALVEHHWQFNKQLMAKAPPLNESRWGVDRSSDGLVGIQWLIDNGDRRYHGKGRPVRVP